jgi:hypothetical protein
VRAKDTIYSDKRASLNKPASICMGILHLKRRQNEKKSKYVVFVVVVVVVVEDDD